MIYLAGQRESGLYSISLRVGRHFDISARAYWSLVWSLTSLFRCRASSLLRFHQLVQTSTSPEALSTFAHHLWIVCTLVACRQHRCIPLVHTDLSKSRCYRGVFAHPGP